MMSMYYRRLGIPAAQIADKATSKETQDTTGAKFQKVTY